MLLVEKNSLYMCYETCPMTPTMSTISKIRELKERAIYKLTLRYGRPFVVFLNTPRLAGAIGSRPEDGNKQIPASVQQLTRAIRSEGVSLAAITRYAKLADSMQSMRMDSDELKGLLRDERTGSGSGSGIISSAYGYLTGRSPADKSDPIDTIETVKAQVRDLQLDLERCKTSGNGRELQQAMQKLQECNDTVQGLEQQIQNWKDSSKRLEDRLREERAENKRLLSMLSAEAQATEREKKRKAEMRRAAEQQRRQAAARLEAGRLSADRRGKKKIDGVVRRGFDFDRVGSVTVKDDEEETKADECGALPAGFVPVTAENFMPVPTAKKISEFADLVDYNKDMILVYSNKSDWTGGKIYCPVVSINITPGRQKDEVTVDKRGVATTLKIGTDIKKEDIFVNEAGFTEFLAGGRTPAAPDRAANTRTRIRFDDDGSETTTQESVTDSFAGIQEQSTVAQAPVAQVEAQKGCEYGSVASAPLGLLGATTLDAEADIKVIFEYASRVRLKKEKILYRSKADDGSTLNVYSGSAYCPIEQWDRVGNDIVLSSRTIAAADIVVANFYVSAEDFWVPLTKAADAKKGYLFRDSNGAILGIIEGQKGSYVGIEGQKGKFAKGAYQRKPDAAEAQTYQSTAPTRTNAPARSAPVDTTPVVPRSTRSTTRADATRADATQAATPSSSDGWEDLPAITDHTDNLKVGDTIRKSGGGKEYVLTKVIKSGVQAKDLKGTNKKVGTTKRLNKKEKWQKKRRLMDRIEDFEGIDGVVPALPSIRIPERHEM